MADDSRHDTEPAWNLTPDEMRLRLLATLAGPGAHRLDWSGFADGELMERALDRVPGAGEVLGSQEVLRYLGAPPQTFRDRRAALREMMPRGWGNLGALQQVEADLEAAARLAERHLAYLEAQGFGFNFNKGLITVPRAKPGARPSLYGDLAKALRDEVRREQPKIKDKDLRERLSPLLYQIFGEDRASAESKAQLDRTLYNRD